jgi:GTP cyclohydrolase I
MKDVQKEIPEVQHDIDHVGIKDIEYPLTLAGKGGDIIHTIATVDMGVYLPHSFRGTHMSRFIEILDNSSSPLSPGDLRPILLNIAEVLEAKRSHVAFKFPIFIKKLAPVTLAASLMSYQCKFSGTYHAFYNTYEIVTQVTIPIMTVCPCSKAISDKGAHNQRGMLKIAIRTENRLLWLEDLIDFFKGSGSQEIYSLLKREDEKYITETSYDNPMFVEDVARKAAQRLVENYNLPFMVDVITYESIHNHSAHARITKGSF